MIMGALVSEVIVRVLSMVYIMGVGFGFQGCVVHDLESSGVLSVLGLGSWSLYSSGIQ